LDIWHESRLYKLWVVGGLIGIVAFAVIGGLSDPSNQDFVLYLIPVIAVWVAGIFILQWRGLRRDVKEVPDAGPSAGLMRWNIGFGAVLCIAIFAGVFLWYAGVGGVLQPLGETGPGLPVTLLPAFALVIYGVVHTLNLVRELGSSRGEANGPTDFEGPTDIQAPEKPATSTRSRSN
jgi:hypothetical protein